MIAITEEIIPVFLLNAQITMVKLSLSYNTLCKKPGSIVKSIVLSTWLQRVNNDMMTHNHHQYFFTTLFLEDS